MPRGVARPDEEREKAKALMGMGDTPYKISKQLGIPYSTVKTWYDDLGGDDQFEEIRTQVKKQFIRKAWAVIMKSICAIEEKVDRGEVVTLGELTKTIGVLYDKQALTANEPTFIADAKKFEDF